jgi:hypothetical protein
MHTWGYSKYGHIPRKIQNLQAELSTLKSKIQSHSSMKQIKEVETALDDMLSLKK